MSLFRPAPTARVLRRVLATTATAMLLTGCSGSVSIGSKTVDAADIESQVSSFLTKQGATDVTVDCPDDLDGKKGATTDCDASDGDGDLRATVTVTSVEGTDVSFDVSAVRVLSAEDAAKQAADILAAQVGQAAPDITCPDELVADVGNTLVCTLTTDDGQTYDTTLTVTDDGGGKTGFDIQVADTPS